MRLNRLFKFSITVTLLSGIFSVAVYADRGKCNQPGNRNAEHCKVDNRFRHNQSYPRRGYQVDRLPVSRHRIHYRDDDFYFSGGIWYRPSGSRYIIVTPPAGIVVSTLPTVYSTLWISGTPYYYANDVYYVWQPDRKGYVVTEPPADIDQKPVSVVADKLFFYPKMKQSEQQQADDRFACHSWGVSQTNYDPSQPPANVSSIELSDKRASYNRALRACMEGKGYSVQ